MRQQENGCRRSASKAAGFRGPGEENRSFPDDLKTGFPVMPLGCNKPTQLTDLSWLAEVREFAPPLAPEAPIWMREILATCGAAIARGERHPCCEISFVLRGEGVEFIQGEEARFAPGDLLMIGPGVPHWVQIDGYPHQALTIFFLPGILLELGPLGDGAVLLRRFTQRQRIGQRLLRLPERYQSQFQSKMRQMWADFQHRPLGWEMRLRASLTELLVAVVAWEQAQGESVRSDEFHEDWLKLERALAYIRRHFAEPIYATDLAHATALSETRLKILFDHTLGIPWTRFLQGYRVRQAATLLCLQGRSVTEVALSAGFESLSHFVRVFRKFTGIPPSDYARQHSLFKQAPSRRLGDFGQ